MTHVPQLGSTPLPVRLNGPFSPLPPPVTPSPNLTGDAATGRDTPCVEGTEECRTVEDETRGADGVDEEGSLGDLGNPDDGADDASGGVGKEGGAGDATGSDAAIAISSAAPSLPGGPAAMGDDAIANRQHHQELPLGGGGGEDGSPDLISRLPDEVLGDIISLLSIRDGARTQAISRRWWPLWRAAPLNLKVYGVLSSERKGVVTKILLSEHTGPVRCFHLHDFELNGCYDYAMLDGWLRSRAFTGLREIYFRYWWAQQPKPMPPSALRFAPTLCVAWIPFCEFPSELSLALGFPHLKKLSLRQVTISEDALHSLLSALWLLCS
ncbi:hypothetical protein HU200_018512 [Digitaria exilis]|uniref:F-box domain-containing protein n=1 Tax=Digitaria exilis TaxID=1010633 RepID=A0A835F4F0_9POAL|nr:hypothetical protein HU200_018512 [Digitaria exilis]